MSDCFESSGERISSQDESIGAAVNLRVRRPSGMDALVSGTESEFSYYVSLYSASSIPDLKERTDGIVNQLGFSDYSFARVFGQSAASITLSGLSIIIPRRLHIDGLFGHDIVYPFDKSSIRPIFKSTVDQAVRWEACGFDFDLGPQPARSAISLDRYNYHNISVDACSNVGKALLSVTQRELTSAELKRKVIASLNTLQVLCKAIDRVTARRFNTLPVYHGDGSQALGVIPSAIFILERLAKSDLTPEQIADQFCVSHDYIQRILENIREEFSVKTNFGAIKQAVLIGLIDVSE